MLLKRELRWIISYESKCLYYSDLAYRAVCLAAIALDTEISGSPLATSWDRDVKSVLPRESMGSQKLNIVIACVGLILLAVIGVRVWSGLRTSNSGAVVEQGGWPNLDVLDNYPNPQGTNCGLNGAAARGSEKGASNALKNRYRLPTGGFAPMLLNDVIGLPVGTALGPPDSHDEN